MSWLIVCAISRSNLNYKKMFVEIDGKYFLFLKNVVVAKDYIMWGWEVSDAIEADKSKLDDEGI